MEWIETTGKTVEDAIEAALDRLGVDESELEYEVVQAEKQGFFARLGGSEARIRARVRPISREKPDTRRRGRPERRGTKGGASRSQGAAGTSAPPPRAAESGSGGNGDAAAPADQPTGSPRRRRRGGRGRSSSGPAGGEESAVTEPIRDDESIEAATAFVEGLLDAFGARADVDAVADEDQWTIEVTGSDLGRLIGVRGATLDAITELARTVVHRQATGSSPRLVVDVAGYRAARRDALAGFARELAERAISTGRAQGLEPMNSADRKVVHDTVGEVEGARTTSEGEDARRRVVILPE